MGVYGRCFGRVRNSRHLRAVAISYSNVRFVSP